MGVSILSFPSLKQTETDHRQKISTRPQVTSRQRRKEGQKEDRAGAHLVLTRPTLHFLSHSSSDLTFLESQTSSPNPAFPTMTTLTPFPSKPLAVNPPIPLIPPGPKSTTWVGLEEGLLTAFNHSISSSKMSEQSSSSRFSVLPSESGSWRFLPVLVFQTGVRRDLRSQNERDEERSSVMTFCVHPRRSGEW